MAQPGDAALQKQVESLREEVNDSVLLPRPLVHKACSTSALRTEINLEELYDPCIYDGNSVLTTARPGTQAKHFFDAGSAARERTAFYHAAAGTSRSSASHWHLKCHTE